LSGVGTLAQAGGIFGGVGSAGASGFLVDPGDPDPGPQAPTFIGPPTPPPGAKRPNLIGPFKVLDCAGFKAARSVLPQTRAQRIEFGGFIYKNSQGGWFYYSAAFSGTAGALPTFDTHRTLDTPKGFSLAGWYHSHPLVPGYPHPELFSGADLGASRRVEGPGYLLVPSGDVLKLLPYPADAPVAPAKVTISACQGG
jgi:hypothetical protein